MEIKVKKNKKELIAIFFAVIISFPLVTFLTSLLNLGVIGTIIPFAYAIICCYYIITFVAVTYTYKTEAGYLIISKEANHKTEILIKIQTENIKSVKSCIKFDGEANNLTAGHFAKDYYVLTYKANSTKKSVKIHKNDELTNLFKSIAGDRVYE